MGIWDTTECSGAPTKVLPLNNLKRVDVNERHNRIFLRFKGMGVIVLTARSRHDFLRRMEVFKEYRSWASRAGVRESVKPPPEVSEPKFEDESQVTTAFQRLDLDGDGIISRSEF